MKSDAAILFILALIFVLIIVGQDVLYSPDELDFGTIEQGFPNTCTSDTTDCDILGTRFYTETCTANSRTGNGCLDPDTGLQFFGTRTISEQCSVSCARTRFVRHDITPHDGQGTSQCRSYVDDIVPRTWFYDGTNDIEPLDPLSPTTCYSDFPNNYAKFKYTCEIVNPDTGSKGFNDCFATDPSTGNQITGSIGYSYYALEPCLNPINQPCGTWLSCRNMNIVLMDDLVDSYVPGTLLGEQISTSPMTCQMNPRISCIGDDTLENVCPTFSSSSPQSAVCRELGEDGSCHTETPGQLLTMVNGLIPDRRAMIPVLSDQLPHDIISIFYGIVVIVNPIACAGSNGPSWENNSYCTTVVRGTVDTIMYGAADSVKNRSGFFMGFEDASGSVTYLAQTLFDIALTTATVTPLDFKDLNMQIPSVSSHPGCTQGQIIEANGILISPIPMGGNEYKFAGIYKGTLFGWMMTGETVLKMISPKSEFEKYLTSEISYIDAVNQTGGTSFVDVRNHLAFLLENWNVIITNVRQSGLYWMPARVDLQRPSSIFGPCQTNAEIFTMTMDRTTYPDQDSLPDILSIGQSPNEANFQITTLVSESGVDILTALETGLDSIYLNLAATVEVAYAPTNSKATLQALLNRGSENVPFTACTNL